MMRATYHLCARPVGLEWEEALCIHTERAICAQRDEPCVIMVLCQKKKKEPGSLLIYFFVLLS